MYSHNRPFKCTSWLLLFFVFIALNTSAQNSPDAAKLPTYIVVSVANRMEIAGGIMVHIDLTNAHDGDELQNLSNYLSTKKTGGKVFNWTDLLNTMDRLGYDYIQALPTRQDLGNLREIEDGIDAMVGGHGEYDHKVVFKRVRK